MGMPGQVRKSASILYLRGKHRAGRSQLLIFELQDFRHESEGDSFNGNQIGWIVGNEPRDFLKGNHIGVWFLSLCHSISHFLPIEPAGEVWISVNSLAHCCH